MFYVGNKGINVQISTGWDLTAVVSVAAVIKRPDGTLIERSLTVLDFDPVLTAGIVKVPILEGDLTIPGVYHIQLTHSGTDVNRNTQTGSFAVATPLKEV